MMCPSEFAASGEPLNITTIEQATAELGRLYDALDVKAADFDSARHQGNNAPREWDTAIQKDVNVYLPIQRRDGLIELGATPRMFAGIQAEYDMQTDPTSGITTIQRFGINEDPGDRYKIDGTHIWRAIRISKDNTIGAILRGEFEVSEVIQRHLFLTDQYEEITDVDKDLRKVIHDLRTYEIG